MLKQSRPTRAMRRTGLCLVAGVTFAFAWTAWASQSSRPATVPAAGRHLDATLRLDVDGKTGQPVQIIHELGSDFEIADGDWRATMVANAAAGGNVALDATLRKNGRVVSAPSVVAKQGEPFAVAVGDAGQENFRIEGTLALADTAPHATKAAAQKTSSDHDATYARMSAPKYPDTALKDHVQGVVFVKVAVAADGSVANAQVDHVEPETAATLGDAAVEAVKSWKFNPAIAGGHAVAADAIVPIEFSLDGHRAAVTAPKGDTPVLDTLSVAAPGKH